LCGFAGEFVFPWHAGAGPAARMADVALAASMAARLTHRGPDEEAQFLSADGRCAIGFRRLAIIDPPGSHQPMSTPDGLLTVAFNGEIYNFRELRNELAADGATFRTAGDTEVILHAYRRWGREMVGRLEGMFAFVLYDAQRQELLLARDPFGQKPLWYAMLPDRVVFASEAPAVLSHRMVDRSADEVAITYYCTVGYIPGPLSAWRGLRKLPPASTLTVSGPSERPRRYWTPQPGPPPPHSFQHAVAAFGEMLRASTAAHMYADVPLGALLSGGLDSSAVTACMCAAAGDAGGVRTFTAGFEGDSTYDERPAARQVAALLGTDHTELVVRAPAAADVDALVAMYAEPFADSSAMATWLICQAARQHVKVALTGDGGDEALGGYDRYRALHLAALLRPWQYALVRLAGMAAGTFARGGERTRLARLVRFSRALPHPHAEQYFRYRRLFGPDDLGRLLAPELLERVTADAPAEWFCGLYEAIEREGGSDGPAPGAAARAGGWLDDADEVARAQRHDMLTYLPDDLLVKSDIASMASSLELRAPLLSTRIAAFGLGLPADWKVARRRGKLVLRRWLEGVLPGDVVTRPKRGFGVPLARWLRGELREVLVESLTDTSLYRRGILRPEGAIGLLNDHLGGRADHSHRLWALLMLARWLAGRGS